MSVILKNVLERFSAGSRVLLLVVCLLLFAFVVGKERKIQNMEITENLKNCLTEKLSVDAVNAFLPLFSFAKEETYVSGNSQLFLKNMLTFFPFYQYGMAAKSVESEQDDRKAFALLMEAESKDEETRILEEMPGEPVEELPLPVVQEEAGVKENLEELMRMENENALQTTSTPVVFVKHSRQFLYDWEALKELDLLKSTFYVFAETTALGSEFLNLEMLQKDLSIDKEAEGPQILIYHTHSQEAFADSVPGDENMTIQGVGEHLAQILREEYGYEVLHHTGQYDVNTRDNAYSRALPEIEQILEDNPSIQVVIDLHRDAANPSREMVVDVDGRPTARFMLFNGISRTKKNGEIKYLYNPNLEDNLAFSFQMQVKAGEYYPGLTRKIYVREYRYNMHVKPRTLLIELGDNSNTVQEAMNACDPIAHILDMVLSPQE